MAMSEQQRNQILSNIKVIGFDLDGTLYNVTPEIKLRVRNLIYQKISTEFNIPLEKATNLFEEIYSETHSGGGTIRDLEQRFGKKSDSDIIQDSLQEADILALIPEDPNLSRLLTRLSESYQLDLLTGGRENLAFEKLKRIGIDKGIFKYLFTKERGRKGNGDLYREWIQNRLDLTPENFLYVGDNKKQDIDIPKELGIKTCFLGDYNQADFQINSILDLERLLLE